MELTEVESTNIYAMDRLQANLAAHGTVFFAHSQTAGKGQHGKSWSAEPGRNIAMSVIIDCSFLLLSQQFPLSMMVALACHDLFSKYAGDETFVKWPNDIYWRDRKAGGILIENQVRGSNWQAAVVGIGINLNQTVFSSELKNPVSLKQITGKDFDTVSVAKELCDCLEKRYGQLKNGSFEKLLSEYNERLFKRGEKVRLKKGAVGFECVISGVSANGELEVMGGLQESYRFGEVEWVLI
jgi:BirA family biotin operon repressor/biotin-[acetyl-CoA-carboxylase] ligase